MCWIAITTRGKLREVLLNQKTRGLDSIWIILWKERTQWKAIRKTYKEYKRYIRFDVKGESDWIAIMHHRKASIGSINTDNAHPFKGKRFSLMHNGTARDFYSRYNGVYRKETDSEALLAYIEQRVVEIGDIPEVLVRLSDSLWEDLWNIIIIDTLNNKVLFYSDWARDSYISLSEDKKKVVWIFNYPPIEEQIKLNRYNQWYENVGHIIMDFNFNIIENTFMWINSEDFFDFYSGRYGMQRCTVNSSVYSTNSYTHNWVTYWKHWEVLCREYNKNLTLSDGQWSEGDLDYSSLPDDEKAEWDYVKSWLSENKVIDNWMSRENSFSLYLYDVWGVESYEEQRMCYPDNKNIKPIHDAVYDEAVVYALF